MYRKEYFVPKRDGSKAKIAFVQIDGIWYWELPDGQDLPLPDVQIDPRLPLKRNLEKIGNVRGQDWVGQIVVDLLKV